MTLADLDELWKGRLWARSRDIEVVAQAVLWLISPHLSADASVDFDKISKTLPGYDREFQRSLGIDKPQPQPWDKRTKNNA